MSAIRSIFERAAEAKPVTGPTSRPDGVRIAVKADERALFDLLMTRAAEENSMAPVNEFKVLNGIQVATERKGGVIGIIDTAEGEVAASVCLVMAQLWYTESWHYEDLWCYVHPDRRKGANNYAQRLIQFAKWFGEQAGCPVLLGVASNTRTLGKIRLYSRNIPLIGAAFLWRGANG
jgi:hypothetical protein